MSHFHGTYCHYCLTGPVFDNLFLHLQAFKDTGKAPVEAEVAIHRIRITLTSRNVKSLEKGNYNFIFIQVWF